MNYEYYLINFQYVLISIYIYNSEKNIYIFLIYEEISSGFYEHLLFKINLLFLKNSSIF